MIKFFFRFLGLVLIIAVSLVIFLSYFGLETDKFDDLIKSKTNEINRHVKVEFKKTKIYLNPKELNLSVKLQNPKILVNKEKITLSKLDLFLPLRSFFTSDFLLRRVEVAFAQNDIKDLTKITKIFVPKIVNKQLNRIFSKGKLEGTFIIPFEIDGSIGKDYGFSGKILNASINLTEEFSIKDLTTEIQHTKDLNADEFKITIQKGHVYDIAIGDTTINLRRKKNETKIKSLVRTNGKLNFLQIKKIFILLGFNTDNLQEVNGTVDLKTNIDFDFDKQFRVKNLSYAIKGNLVYCEIYTKPKKVIKKYLPEYDPKIIVKNVKVNLIKIKSGYTTELEGLVKAKDHFDNFKIKSIFNSNDKNININGVIDLTNSKVRIARLNYNKNNGIKSEINFDTNFVLNKYYNIKDLNFVANKTNIHLSNIKLNKNFKVNDFKKLEIKTFVNEVKNNDFSANKSEKITISGNIFDAQPLLKLLYRKSDRKTFSKNFNSEIKIHFDKTLSGTNDDISNFAMIASINKGLFSKLSLKGNFSKDEILEMSIYQVDKDKKTLQVISDRARPFVKNFDFIQGFEGGKLEYDSTILKDSSNSNLTIKNFKVSKVPALAQLLTLASLQGIADTLSGEGIRFESFEMKSNSKGNILTIEDALAMGPAVSILLEGYVDKGKVVSLRGTLVPATKLNAIIASIPIVGDILVGKKTGEGVVGVSFKMKGAPKNIKTTVNPIKTLTPRFIVRAIEKIKKEKKEKVK